MKKVLVPLADGVEEMEASIIVDTLRRAKWEVITAGLKEGPVVASRDLKIIPDMMIDDVPDCDMIIIPGGMGGVGNLRKDKRIIDIIKNIYTYGFVAAICAGPLLLQDAGILEGKKITCHPAVEKQINTCEVIKKKVVIDGNTITSQGPGTTFDFVLSIIELIEGEEKAESLAEPMIFKREKAYVVKSEK